MIQEKYGDLKIIRQREKLKAIREGIVAAPVSVRVKPTNKCEHSCFYCSYHPESGNILSANFNIKDQIPKNKMMEILDDFKDIGVNGVTYSGGGEPLVYPFITEVFEKTLNYGIDLSIITNGQKLREEKAEYLTKAKWVRISLDACTAKTFSESRRVSERLFYELEKNIKDFAKIKNKNCELGINFVVHHINKNEVYDAAKFFKELGVNHVKFTPRWIDKKGEWLKYHEPFQKNVIEQIENVKEDLIDKNFDIFDTYENDFKLTGVPRRTYSTCPIMHTVPVIGADSMVYFCHDKTYMNNGILGSLKDKSFKELWFSKEAKEIFDNFNPKKECQQHCTYDSRNIKISQAKKNYEILDRLKKKGFNCEDVAAFLCDKGELERLLNSYNEDHINFI